MLSTLLRQLAIVNCPRIGRIVLIPAVEWCMFTTAVTRGWAEETLVVGRFLSSRKLARRLHMCLNHFLRPRGWPQAKEVENLRAPMAR
jgi:hypothetical protein